MCSVLISIILLFINAVLQKQVANIGKPVEGPMPKDCLGVNALGWKKSGYYTVTGTSSVYKTLYCDFTKAPGSSGNLF